MNDRQVAEKLHHGLALQRQGLWDQAAAEYGSVLNDWPEHARALHLLGLIRATQGLYEEAKTLLVRAVQADPSDIATVSNLAKLLLSMNELGFALKMCRSGMAIRPDFVPLYLTEASVLQKLGRNRQALISWEEARMIAPNSSEVLNGLCVVLQELGIVEQPSPQGLDVLFQEQFYLRTGERFYDAGVYQGALSCLNVCLARGPDDVHAQALRLLTLMHACAWEDLAKEINRLFVFLVDGDVPIPPFALLALVDDPVLHLRRAQNYFGMKSKALRPDFSVQRGGFKHSDARVQLRRRGRVAYISADFHDHATSRLMVEMLEQHNRSHWEVMGVSLGPDEETPMRKRISAAFEQFIDARELTDAMIVSKLKKWGADIVIDVKGLTEGSREHIFQMNPAPIIVNFLAYPGSMGASEYGYILGDTVVTPFEDAPNYSEKIVQLPGSYQCNGIGRQNSSFVSSRELHGLPVEGVVFAGFNNSYKINRTVFLSWMRILLKVPGSVLWLTCDDSFVQNNLRREAELSGVDPVRLIFARRVPWPMHLARVACADLLLDTWPYNAHTTASDALWMGVPVLTCVGKTFASRVAASLLTAMGLPELIEADHDSYVAAAIRWGCDPEGLKLLKDKVLTLRQTSSLFDASRYARNLEQAWAVMLNRQLNGLGPTAFRVRDIKEGGGFCFANHQEFTPVSDLFANDL